MYVKTFKALLFIKFFSILLSSLSWGASACNVTKEGDEFRFEISKAGAEESCVANIPFPIKKGSIALSLEISGEGSLQYLEIGGSAGSNKVYTPLKHAYEILPYGIEPKFRLGVVLLDRNDGYQGIMFKLTKPGKGKVALKNISSIPVPKGLENWDALPVVQSSFDNEDLEKFQFAAFNFFGPKLGWKLLFVTFAPRTSPSLPETSTFKSTEPVKSSPSHPLTIGMWVWESEDIFNFKQKSIEDLIAFAKQRKIKKVFVQVHHERKVLKDNSIYSPLKYQAGISNFLKQANTAGLEVYALDGFSRYPLKPWHADVLAQIQGILDFNRQQPKGAKFAGIHHDNEPYLIPQFWGPAQEQIIQDYLTLTAESAALIRKEGEGMTFGIDIPFWYDQPSQEDGKIIEATFNGQRKPLSEHLIDINDYVGIMDYRTKFEGLDGVANHAKGELDYASRVGKKIFIGIETFNVADEVYIQATAADRIQPNVPRQDGYVISTTKHNGVVIFYFGKDISEADWKTVTALYPTWKPRIATQVSAAKMTFSQFPPNKVDAMIERVFKEFEPNPAFAGMMVHYYKSYRELVGKEPLTVKFPARLVYPRNKGVTD